MEQRSSRLDRYTTGRRPFIGTAVLITLGVVCPASGLDESVPRVGGDTAAALFGNGTGTVVGIIDNGVNVSHPGLAGNDSLGQARLVAQADFAFDNWNSPADSTGHGTGVAGVALSNFAGFMGLAPDARYVNARVSDTNLSSNTTTVIDGMDFALANGADVLNLSLNDPAGSTNNGNNLLTLAADYVVDTLNVPVVVSAGNYGNFVNHEPTSPADGHNVIAVGGTWQGVGAAANYNEGWLGSAYGPIANGRSKPDLVAPAVNVRSLGLNGSSTFSQTGTSFAAPHVTGTLALQIGYGEANGLGTDPRVLKATLLNSAEKLPGGLRTEWTPGGDTNGPVEIDGVYTISRPLDPYVGAGQLDAEALYGQYTSGEQDAGQVGVIGWDLATIERGQTLDYELGAITSPTTLTGTAVWHRAVARVDSAGGNEVIDAQDFFIANTGLSNLELDLLRDGELVAQSISAVDSLEHLHLELVDSGFYTLRVRRDEGGFGPNAEPYALAWSLLIDGESPFGAGDVNGDTIVTLADIEAFVEAIVDPQAFVSNRGHNAWLAADTNYDGLVNLSDVEYFSSLLNLSTVQQAELASLVPETGTTSIFLFWAISLLRRRKRSEYVRHS